MPNFDTPKSSAIYRLYPSGTIPANTHGILDLYVTVSTASTVTTFYQEVTVPAGAFSGTYNIAVTPRPVAADVVTTYYALGLQNI